MTVVGRGQVESAGVKVESQIDPAKGGTAVVTNVANVPLTAYLLDVVIEPCAPMQPRAIPRAADAIVLPDGQPLLPSESRTETLGTSPCNKIGVSTPAKAAFRAAIFQDGSTSGDQASVAMLLDNRRLVLEECEMILDRLKAPDAAARTPEALNADVRARIAAAVEKRPPAFAPLVDLASLISPHLEAERDRRAGQLARAVNELERLQTRLLNSRPPLR